MILKIETKKAKFIKAYQANNLVIVDYSDVQRSVNFIRSKLSEEDYAELKENFNFDMETIKYEKLLYNL